MVIKLMIQVGCLYLAFLPPYEICLCSAEDEHELVQELGSQKAGAADAGPARHDSLRCCVGFAGRTCLACCHNAHTDLSAFQLLTGRAEALLHSSRYTEEVAAFQEEQSLTSVASEASPWTHLQKTYSNVEDSAHSTSGQHAMPKCSTTLHQETIIHDGCAVDAQVSSSRTLCPHTSCNVNDHSMYTDAEAHRCAQTSKVNWNAGK